MHPLVQTIVVVGIAASAIALALSAMELRQIRSILQVGKFRLQARAWQPTDAGSVQHAPGLFFSKAGFAVYTYREGKWVLEADYSKPGYEAVGPAIAGTYENQVVKKESALKGKG
jgi:hypothetical protein